MNGARTADSAKLIASYKFTHHDGIDQIIYLLKNIAQKHGNRKGKQQSCRTPLRHVQCAVLCFCFLCRLHVFSPSVS